jgi:hypothetical protein
VSRVSAVPPLFNPLPVSLPLHRALPSHSVPIPLPSSPALSYSLTFAHYILVPYLPLILISHPPFTPPQLNLTQTPDPGPTPATSWVGRTATGPHDYPRHSALGPAGLRLLLGVVNDPKGALVVWVKAGHCVQQEGRAVLLDLLDALARPSAEYVGDVFLGGAGAGGTGAGATGTTGSTSK